MVSGQQCGTVGRVGSTRTGDNRARDQFFIDRGNRAGCAGMITSLSYCFYRPPMTDPVANEFLTTASTNTDENVFTVVSSPITIQKSATDLDDRQRGNTQQPNYVTMRKYQDLHATMILVSRYL